MPTNPQITQDQRAELRHVIQMNRLAELLEAIENEAKATKNHYSALRVGYMEKLFQRIYSEISRDWKIDEDVLNPEDRRKFREAVVDILFITPNDDESGKRKKLFDENGFAIRYDGTNEEARTKFAETLANFYEKVRGIKPESEDLKVALNFFIVALCKLPVVAEVYPEGLDFRRLDQGDIANLASKELDAGKITAAFNKATNPAIVKPLMNHYQPPEKISGLGTDGKPMVAYSELEDHTEYVAGVPFLSHVVDKQKYLVTMNGGLVPLEKVKGQLKTFFDKNGIISDFSVKKEDITGWLRATDNIPNSTTLNKQLDELKTANQIAGAHIDGQIPLVCLDVNIMSGLRPARHENLMNFLQSNKDLLPIEKNRPVDITSLYNPEKSWMGYTPFLNKLSEVIDKNQDLAAEEKNSLKRALTTAYEHVNLNMRDLQNHVIEKFSGKTRHKDPANPAKMYMTMGGCGSGKSIVEDLVRKECTSNGKDDFVISALDSFREHCPLNTLLLAANHHSDDYSIIDPYAQTLREMVNKKAMEEKVNLLCDGTGIEYKGRNDKIVSKCKEAGFITNLIGVDVNYQDAVHRANSRFRDDNRILPWVRVADKHKGEGKAVLEAFNDRNLNHIAIIDTSRGKGKQYLIAESIDKTREEVYDLKKLSATGLLDSLIGVLSGDLSIAKRFLGIKQGQEEINVGNIPQADEKNVSFLSYPKVGKDGADRVVAIYDVKRFAEIGKKYTMNPYANAPEADLLEHTPASMPFYMPRSEEGWRARITKEGEKIQDTGLSAA